jgi:ABC-2 type transport system ATP-binding protein
LVELRRIRKSFAGTVAVRDLSFQAMPGEIFGIIGPNGAGKSTAIRILMNILAPDGGDVLVSGKSLRPRDKARIGYLPEERGVYPRVRVSQFLRYLGELKGMSGPAAEDAARRWLERFGLADRKESKTDTLSKGMTQKVQFVGAVQHDPDVVVLDEPFSGLDPVSTETVKDAVLELKRAGKVVLFSTHLMEHAERLCDRLVMVHRGEAVLSGSLREIRERYGSNTVQIEFDGDASDVRASAHVSAVTEYPRYLEATLTEAGDSNALLGELLERARIHRFERLAASLHRIFVETAGESADA